MIENAKQYEITKKWAQTFNDSAQAIREDSPEDLHPKMADILSSAHESMHLSLVEEIQEYEERTAIPKDQRFQIQSGPTTP